MIKAETRRFTDRLFVSGTLTAREEVMVATKIADLTIVEIDAEDGDHVKQGQLLARLDRSQLDAQLAQSDAARARADAAINQANSMIAQSASQVDFASNDYDRAKKLGAGVMAVSTVEQRETKMKSAQAALAAAKDALAVAQADRAARDADRQELMVRIGRTEVRAPVDGLISLRSARLGATAVMAGDPLFRIISHGDDRPLRRRAGAMAVAAARPGCRRPSSCPASRRRSAARSVWSTRKSTRRAAPARRASRSPTSATRGIGAFASGEIDLVSRDGVAAPTTAVKREGDEGVVLIVKDGEVESRKVKLGIVEGDEIEIKSGVSPGETLVARAASFLRPGDKVRPMPQVVGAGG